MKSSYALYIEEREGKSILEDHCGFATYFYPEENIVYIEDVFVKKEYRRSGVAKRYFEHIIALSKKKGCEYCLTSIDPKDENYDRAEAWTKKYNYTYTKNQNNLDWFCKEI